MTRQRGSSSADGMPNRSDNFTWCLTESQTWVGADVLRADCDTDPSDPTCSGDVTAIPEDSIRMANLYEDDIVRNRTSAPHLLVLT